MEDILAPSILDRTGQTVCSARSCPHGHSALSRARRRHVDGCSIVLEELSGVRERPMIISMPTTARVQQRSDHRLRNLVQRTGDVTIATDLGVPRSTAPWVARPGTEGRGEPGRDGPDGRGTPARSLGAPTTREEAHRTPSAGTRSTSKLRIHVDARERLPDGRAKIR